MQLITRFASGLGTDWILCISIWPVRASAATVATVTGVRRAQRRVLALFPVIIGCQNKVFGHSVPEQQNTSGSPVGGRWPVVGSRPHPPDGRNHTMYLACIEWRWCERVEVSLFFQFRVGQLSLHWLWNRMNSVEMVYNVDLIGNELNSLPIFEWHEHIHWLLYVSHYCGANNVRVQLL